MSAASAPVELLERLRGDGDRRPMVDRSRGVPRVVGGRKAMSCEPWDPGQSRSWSTAGRCRTGTELRTPADDPAGPCRARERPVPAAGDDRTIDDPVAKRAGGRGGKRAGRPRLRVPRPPPVRRPCGAPREIVHHAEVLVTTWPAVAPAWLPRTGERRTIPDAGGRIVLLGVIDLVLGAPALDRASVCLVDVRTGERRAHHTEDRHFFGLLETICAGAPPSGWPPTTPPPGRSTSRMSTTTCCLRPLGAPSRSSLQPPGAHELREHPAVAA